MSIEWWKTGVIYQVYPRSFRDSTGDGVGDIAGIIDGLDYIAWLGCDAVWLSPVYPSPMRDFGYDVSDYCDIDPGLGTLEEFDALVHEAHRRDLRVILDFVTNHTSDLYPWCLDAAFERGVRLTCTGTVRARSVAEFTLALTMDQLLNVSRIHHAMRTGKRFPRFGYTQELTTKTVGVIGFGAISRDFIELLKPFRTTNLIFSSHASADELRAKNASPAGLDEVAARSDVVVVLTGLTVKTQKIIGASFLKMMKDDALLVNTARGKLVDESALVRELETGRLRAALDVYYDEPLDENSPLRTLETVTLTAHSANSTREMDCTRWEFALNELQGFSARQELAGELDREHLARMSDD